MTENIKYTETSIGLIPSDWKVEKLGSLGKVISGLTYSPDDVKEEGVLVLRSSNIQDRKLKFLDNVYVNVSIGNFNPVKKGDILICVRNGSKSLIGKNALITEQIDGVAFGAFMAIFRSEFSEYLFQIFGTDLFQKEIHKNLGATINSINGSDLKLFKIPVPPIPEQEKIAALLSTWDVAIDNCKNIIEKISYRNKGLAQQLLTGKIRVNGFGGKWDLLKLSEIADVRDGTHESPKYHKEGIKFITSKNIKDGSLDFSNVSYISIEDANNFDKRSKVDNGDILMSMIGTIGNSVLIKSDPDFCIKNVGLIKPRKIYSNYLIQYFHSKLFQNYLLGKLDGGIQKFVSLSELRGLKIPVPSFEEQKAIANILDKATEELNQYQQKLEALQLQKKGLMQRLLTGKVRVKI